MVMGVFSYVVPAENVGEMIGAAFVMTRGAPGPELPLIVRGLDPMKVTSAVEEPSLLSTMF